MIKWKQLTATGRAQHMQFINAVYSAGTTNLGKIKLVRAYLRSDDGGLLFCKTLVDNLNQGMPMSVAWDIAACRQVTTTVPAMISEY